PATIPPRTLRSWNATARRTTRTTRTSGITIVRQYSPRRLLPSGMAPLPVGPFGARVRSRAGQGSLGAPARLALDEGGDIRVCVDRGPAVGRQPAGVDRGPVHAVDWLTKETEERRLLRSVMSGVRHPPHHNPGSAVHRVKERNLGLLPCLVLGPEGGEPLLRVLRVGTDEVEASLSDGE